MELDREAQILYAYIVLGISTKDLKEKGVDISEWNQISSRYNINYPDKGYGNRQGFRNGYHLGKYKKGYVNQSGQCFEVTLDVIFGYMECYLNGEYATLEDYLYDCFENDENDEFYDSGENAEEYYEEDHFQKNIQQTYSSPQKNTYYNYPHENSQTNYQTAHQNNYTQSQQYSASNQRYYPRSSFSVSDIWDSIRYDMTMPKLLGIIGAILLLIGIITTIISLIVGAGAGKREDAYNPIMYDEESGIYYLDEKLNGVCDLEMQVDFEGNDIQMWFKEPYIFHIDDMDSEMKIGKRHTYTVQVNRGNHSIWISSGNAKSDRYNFTVLEDSADLYFECAVGMFGPVLTYKAGKGVA